MFYISKHRIHSELRRLRRIGEIANQFRHTRIKAAFEYKDAIIFRAFMEVSADSIKVIARAMMINRHLDHMPLDHERTRKAVEVFIGARDRKSVV